MKENKESKGTTISFKVSKEYKLQLEEKVKETGMDTSEYIRCALSNKPVIVLANSAAIAREFAKLNELLSVNDLSNNCSELQEIRREVRNLCKLLDSLLTEINL